MYRRLGRAYSGPLAALAMALLALSAKAQLTSEITRATGSLTPQQRQIVADYASQGLDGLRSPEAAVANEARQSLLNPLKSDASRVFRQVYSDELADRLADLARDTSVTMASRLGAVNIIGALASDEGLKALEKTLSSDETAVRYATATALERAMLRAGSGAHGFLNLNQTMRTVSAMITQAAAAEANPDICRALIQAAAAIPSAGASVDAVAGAMLAQMRAVVASPSIKRVEPFRVGLERMQNRYVVELLNDPEVAKHEYLMARAAAATLQVVVRHVNDPDADLDDGQRDRYAGVARTAENLLNILTRQTKNPQTHVANALATGRYADAASSIQSFWLSPQGPLCSDPDIALRSGEIEELLKQ